MEKNDLIKATKRARAKKLKKPVDRSQFVPDLKRFIEGTRKRLAGSSTPQVKKISALEEKEEAMAKRGIYATEHEDPSIVPIPKRISVHQPDYTTIRLRYVTSGSIQNGTGGTDRVGLNFCVNTLFNPLGAGAGTYLGFSNDNYDGAGGPAANHHYNGFDMWRSRYKYYRVLHTNVKVYVANMGADAGSTQMTFCGVGHSNLNPYTASDVTGVHVRYGVLEAKHFEMQPVFARDGGRGVVEYTRSINPGEYTADVAALEQAANGEASAMLSKWQKVDRAKPTTPLFLYVGHQSVTDTNDDTTGGAGPQLNYILQSEVTVQFREQYVARMMVADDDALGTVNEVTQVEETMNTN